MHTSRNTVRSLFSLIALILLATSCSTKSPQEAKPAPMPEWIQGKWNSVTLGANGQPTQFQKYVFVQGNIGYEAFPSVHGRGTYSISEVQPDQVTLQITWETNPFGAQGQKSTLKLKRQDSKLLFINDQGPFTR